MPGELSGAPEGAEGTRKEVTEQDVEKAKVEMDKAYIKMLDKKEDFDRAHDEFKDFFDELKEKDDRELTSEQKEQLQRLNQAVKTASSDYIMAMRELEQLDDKFFELDTEFGNK